MRKIRLILTALLVGCIVQVSLAQKAKDGWQNLFNGKDLTGWKGLVGNPITRSKMSAKELATAQAKADKEAAESWVVAENGDMLFTGKGNNLCTDKEYGDFEMLVDWKLYPGKEPDAGIYLRGTPQVQMWDISRTNVGAEVGSGVGDFCAGSLLIYGRFVGSGWIAGCGACGDSGWGAVGGVAGGIAGNAFDGG